MVKPMIKSLIMFTFIPGLIITFLFISHQKRAYAEPTNLKLYDDFNDSTYDESYNNSLWNLSCEGFYQVRQTNGYIEFSNSASPSGGDCALVATQPYSRKLSQIKEFQARLYYSSDHSGSYAFTKIQIISYDLNGLNGRGWWTQCGIKTSASLSQPYFKCDVFTYDGQNNYREYESRFIDVNYDTWYTAKIEADPIIGNLSFFIDGTLVDDYTPDDAALIIAADNLHAVVGVWNTYSNTYATRQIDDVFITDSGLWVSHIEITQATQTITNSVPLIAGKPTFVRVYVDCGVNCTSLPDITGVLRGFDQTGELPGSPLSPVNSSITAYHESVESQREDLRKTLNFTLPPEWLTGTITLTAEVEGAVLSEEITFEAAWKPLIYYVPIHYNPPDYSGVTDPTDRIETANSWANLVYPTHGIIYLPGNTLPWSQCLEKDSCDQWYDHRHNLLNRLNTLYRNVDHDYIFGWLPMDTYSGGTSDREFRAAFGDDHLTRGKRFFAHEIGHLMNRKHTNTTDNLKYPEECILNNRAVPEGYEGTPEQWRASVDLSTDWKFPNSKIQDFGLLDFSLGWPISASSALLQPDTTFDYMSYCGTLVEGNVWTSPWTYEHIFSETLKTQPLNLSQNSISTPQPYFISSGLVYTDNAVLLDPIWVISSTVTPKNPQIGTQYCLEALDDSDVPLVSQCFDLSFVDYETGEGMGVDSFNFMLPYPEYVSRIALKKGTQELAEQVVSQYAPSVTVVTPDGGESWSETGTYTITWTSDDLDGDILTYSVFYSSDGSDWLPVGGIISETQMVVNAAELAGGNEATVRVMASDGINTTIDESDSAFTVGSKSPNAFILSPEGGNTIQPNTPIYLQGYSYDLEDGVLDDTALIWSSNLDGPIGTGSLVMVNLSPGEQIITLSVTDSDDNTTTSTISIFVGHKIFVPLVSRD